MDFRVVVHGLRGERVIIDVCDTEEQFQSVTVLQLKEMIKETGICDFAGNPDVRLIFADRLLHDDSALLREYGMKNMSVIHLVLRLPGGGSGPDPGVGDSGMGDKGGKNRSMEKLANLRSGSM